MRAQPGAQYLSRALILCDPCEISQKQLEELPYCWNQALTSTRTALFIQKTFSCECVCGQTDSEIGIKARSVSWSHSRSLVLSTLLFYSIALQHKMHKSLLLSKSTFQGVSLCCSFLSVSGLALFAVEQLNSAGSFPVSKTVWWSWLSSGKGEGCVCTPSALTRPQDQFCML